MTADSRKLFKTMLTIKKMFENTNCCLCFPKMFICSNFVRVSTNCLEILNMFMFSKKCLGFQFYSVFQKSVRKFEKHSWTQFVLNLNKNHGFETCSRIWKKSKICIIIMNFKRKGKEEIKRKKEKRKNVKNG